MALQASAKKANDSPLNPPSNSQILMPTKPQNLDLVYTELDLVRKHHFLVFHELASNTIKKGEGKGGFMCKAPEGRSLNLYSILTAI